MVAEESEHYLVDDITVSTPCELLYQQRKKMNWSRTALLKCLSKVGQFMAGRFRKYMLGSWSIESSQDGKTLTSRSLEAMEKRN